MKKLKLYASKEPYYLAELNTQQVKGADPA
jgi:hypothetical protein